MRRALMIAALVVALMLPAAAYAGRAYTNSSTPNNGGSDNGTTGPAGESGEVFGDVEDPGNGVLPLTGGDLVQFGLLGVVGLGGGILLFKVSRRRVAAT